LELRHADANNIKTEIEQKGGIYRMLPVGLSEPMKCEEILAHNRAVKNENKKYQMVQGKRQFRVKIMTCDYQALSTRRVDSCQ
jgi:hypothetical protein